MNTTTALPLSARCVGYVRVSTERQAGETLTSLADQEAAIRSLASRLGVTVDAWYRDEGASGATEDRPAFRALLAACEAQPRPASSPGLVLVLNDSRFGRFSDPDQAAALRWRFKQAGWVVRFAEGDDVDGTFRSVVRSLGAAQASEYLANLKGNTRRGMRGTGLQGFWTREAPFGYRRRVVYPPGAERVLERGELKTAREKVKLTPHTAEASAVRWMFEAYASGSHSLGSIAAAMLERFPERRWSRTVVQHVLRNEAYIGDVIGGRRPSVQDRAHTPRRAESEWYRCEGAHAAIVTRDLFGRVQQQLSRNQGGSRGQRGSYLLSGLLACPYCALSYAGGGGGRSVNRNPTRSHRRFYRDGGGVLGVCPGRIGTVSRHFVDDAVMGLLAETIASPQVSGRIEAEVDRALRAAAGSVRESVSGLRAARAKLEAQRERLITLIADGTILKEEADSQLRRIRAELGDIDARIQASRFVERSSRQSRTERDRLVRVALEFPALAARLEGAKLRRLIEPWIAGATFDKVTRELAIAVRRVPALVYLPASSSPARAVHEEARPPLVRTTSLLQPGHGYRVARAREDLRRAGGAP